MKKILGSILIVVMCLFTFSPVLADEVATPTSSPSASPSVTVSKCEVIKINGPNAFIQCLDSLGNIIPAGQVDLPSIIKSILVPGPMQTVTLTPSPQPAKTVTVPGPTQYVTLKPEKVFVPSSPLTRWIHGPVVTKTPAPIVVSVTETPAPVTVTKVVPQVDKSKPEHVLFDLPPVSTPRAVGYSIIGLAIICGLIIFGLWMGYILGYKDKERLERKFLDALRDQFYYKGEHS